MTAYGYIRKSVVHDPARTLSPETQEAAIRGLAERHGDADVIVLSDLDVSGKKRRNKRPGWDELLRAVEDGEASAVYAYSLSRFARSVSQLAEFFDLCDGRRIPIRVERDHIDTSSATGKLVVNVLASLAQFESDVSSERVKDAFAAKRRRDPEWHGPGNRPYGALAGEDASLVLAAFRAAGSYDGAARLLNARKVRARGDGAVWHGTTVTGIIRRLIPDEVAPGTTRGAKAGNRTYRLARLLACGTCGSIMSPSLDTRRGFVRYSCRLAHITPHGRGWVSEHRILPGVKAEAERAEFQIKRLQVGKPEDEQALSALASKRSRVIDTYTDGLIDKAERDRRLAEIAESESKLSTRRWIRRIAIPPVIADTTDEDGVVVKGGDPATVNAYLRRLFDRVTVDMSQPARRGPSHVTLALRFDWRDPSLRVEESDDEDAAAS